MKSFGFYLKMSNKLKNYLIPYQLWTIILTDAKHGFHSKRMSATLKQLARYCCALEYEKKIIITKMPYKNIWYLLRANCWYEIPFNQTNN